MTPEDLQTALARALATADPALIVPGAEAPIDITTPARVEHGDWSTRVALRAAAAPEHRLSLAQHLCTSLGELPEIASAEVAGPGFVNITLTPAARARIAFDIVQDSTTDPRAEAAVTVPCALTLAGVSGPRAVDVESVTALQRGHAAACRERRRAEAAEITTATAAPADLAHPSEARVLHALNALPVALEHTHRLGEVGPFLHGLLELAEATEEWLHRCAVTPPIDVNITALHASRLVLVRAVIIVLAAGLRQLGASAPERI